jgi:molecular chaperone DnaK
MPVPGFALGIDLGTSNTVAILRWPDGRVRPLMFDGTPLLPSAVYAEPGRNLLTGRDAVHSARVDPARYEPNPKRRIDDGTVLLGDTEVPVVDLFAAVLGRVLEEARRIAGGAPPGDVTLTCPAAWAAPRRAVLTSAAAEAGLGTVRLVEEPVAAAAYFVSVLGRETPTGSVVVVHDLGAGTFDASVVARTAEGGFEVIAVDGRGDVGGLDIDAALVAHLGHLFAAKDPTNWARLTTPSTVEERRYRRLLWDDVRVAKERLSRAQTADLVLPLLDIDVHLTREELERLAQPILEQTVQVTLGAMRWADLRVRNGPPGDVPGQPHEARRGGTRERRTAGVFLVGGASRIPLMATLLHRALGEPPVVIEQPELVVAEGSLFAPSTRPTDPSATVLVSALVAELETMAPLEAGPAAAPTPAGLASAPPSSPVSPAGPGTPGASPVSPAPAGIRAQRAFAPGRAAPPAPVPATRPSTMPPTRVMPRAPEPPAPVSPPLPGYRPREPVYPRADPVVPARLAPPYQARERNRFLSFLCVLLVTVLLCATPVVAAYVTYKLALHEPLLPVSVDWRQIR